MPLSTGARLGPYQILVPIGAGGMGEVYKARDKKLDRDVAIKVLPQSVAADPDTLARFEREAKAVAALSHQNILAIHDFGNQDGIAYAVMELLEGATLREKLKAGPIPPRQALDYAIQIAKGLSAAHEKGIIHRDLKPENVFVARDGHVKILDFGLAKRTEPRKTGDETDVRTQPVRTEPGTVMGTVGYMSPEQVRGLEVDHRSDIFSFGVILYEMLSGRRAFQGATPIDTLTAILSEDPAELSESGRSVPPALDHAVKHCLEKSAGQRFQSAKDIVFALTEASGSTTVGAARFADARPPWRRMAVAAGAAVLVALAGALLLRRPPPAATSGPRRIAVLPFENLGSPDQDYFADGVADEVRGKLTSLASLAVIARGSSTPYKKTTKTPQQIAQELGVSYLLTGTIRWEKAAGGGRVHVTPELVEIKKEGAPEARWQERFEAELTDVFRVQSEIAARVAGELGVALGNAQEKRLAEKPTGNLEAYQEFLRGEEASVGMSRVDPGSLRRAVGHYERAVALDPSFALAWANLGRARSLLYFNSTPAPELAAEAKQAAEKALALAPDRAAPHVAMGSYERSVLKDNRRALESYERARRLEPGNASVIGLMAVTNLNLGRWEPAVENLREALKADPLSVANRAILGRAFRYLRRLPEARDVLDGALSLAPTNLDVIEKRAMVSLAEGDLAGAREVIRSAPKQIDPKALVAYFAMVQDLGWALERDQRELLLRLTPADFDNDKGTWGLYLALEYEQRGDSGKAMTLGAQAAEEYRKQLAAAPEDWQRHSLLGFALALAGQKADAIREGVRGAQLLPVERDAYNGPYLQHVLARIYILAGEQEKALDTLEPLLKMPYYLTPAWLKIDPNFDPLRGNPRFQKLVAAAK
jgi:TolB-like protein/tRNA A-37 threonylcarbamoyl transferase component Bud32/Flp pilus assembly protein TadD